MRAPGLIGAILREHVRDTSYSLWSLILPPATYIVARLFLSDGSPARDTAIFSATLLGATCALGCVSFPLGLRGLEDAGLGRALALRPVSARAMAASATIADSAIALVACVLVLAAALVTGVPILGTWVTGTLAAVAVGMALGATLWSTGAGFMTLKSLGNIVMLVYMLGAGVLFPLPGLLDRLGSILPSYQIHRHFATGAPGPLAVCAVWVAGAVVMATVLASRRRTDA